MEKRLQAKRICRICGLWLLGLVGRESRGFRYNPRNYEGFRKLGVPFWGDFFLRIRIQLGSTFGSPLETLIFKLLQRYTPPNSQSSRSKLVHESQHKNRSSVNLNPKP